MLMHTVHMALLSHRQLTKENQRSKENPCCPPLPQKRGLECLLWNAQTCIALSYGYHSLVMCA